MSKWMRYCQQNYIKKFTSFIYFHDIIALNSVKG